MVAESPAEQAYQVVYVHRVFGSELREPGPDNLQGFNGVLELLSITRRKDGEHRGLV